MNITKHLSEQPFIAATGLAALVHSTWSLAVLFSGEPPHWEPTDPVSLAHWAYWLLPALMIAFAMDIGQISTSSQIRAGARGWRKYLTFMVLSAFTYYLQWTYIVHHMPALELGEGVYKSGLAGSLVMLFRNAAVWIIPALLPVSTSLYTLSDDKEPTPKAEKLTIVTEQIEVKPAPALEESFEAVTAALPINGLIVHDDHYTVLCDDCGWESGKSYKTSVNAARALAAHQRLCPSKHPVPNGNGHHEVD